MNEEHKEEESASPPPAETRPGVVSVSGAAPTGKPRRSSQQIASTVAPTGQVAALEPGHVESAKAPAEDAEIAQLNNSARIEPMEPEGLGEAPAAAESSKPAPSAVADSGKPAAASGRAPRSSRRADAKAVIREEMNALRSQGLSQTPGAVTVDAAGTGAASAPAASMNSKAAIKQEMAALRNNEEMQRPGAHSVATSAPTGKGGGGSRAERPSRRAKTSATTGTGDEKVRRSSITASAAAQAAVVVSKPGATAGTSANERTKSGGSSKAGAVSATASDEKSKIMKGGDATTLVSASADNGSNKKLEEERKAAAGAGAGVAVGMVLPEQSSKKSVKDKSSTELGMHASSPLMEEGMVSAQVIDEEELEAQYQEKLMANAVAAEIVDEDEFKESGRCWKMSCCCILIIAIVCAIAIPLSKKEDDLTFPPTPSPTEQDEYDYLYDLVKELSGDALDDNSTAAYQALQWLAFDDPADLPIKESNETTILQRYAAAVFYYSTEGDLWTSDLNAMSNSTLCDWNDGGIGFLCVDGDPAVKQLIISEFISRCYTTFCLLLPYTNVCPAFF
jgi:hypothetical protein